MKTIHLHIGNYKTGSTAIQMHLGRNRDKLLKTGYYIPRQGWDGSAHHELIWAIRGENFARSKQELLPALRAEVDGSGYPEFIISTEIMFPGTEAQELVDAFGDGYQFKVIAYLRRQDIFLSAFYQQMIKHWRFRSSDKPNVEQLMKSRSVKYLESLKRWEDAVGVGNLIIRPYEKSQLNNGLLYDFIRILDRDPVDFDEAAEEDKVNETIHTELIEYLRLANAIDMTKSEHESLLEALNTLSKSVKPGVFSHQNVLSPQDRIEILRQSQSDNFEIAQKYLGREDGVLFFDPEPDPDEEWTPVSLSTDDLARIGVGLWLDLRGKTSCVSRLYEKNILSRGLRKLLKDRADLLLERRDLFNERKEK